MTECKGLHFCQGLPNWFAVLLQPSLKTLDHSRESHPNEFNSDFLFSMQRVAQFVSLNSLLSRIAKILLDNVWKCLSKDKQGFGNSIVGRLQKYHGKWCVFCMLVNIG